MASKAAAALSHLIRARPHHILKRSISSVMEFNIWWVEIREGFGTKSARNILALFNCFNHYGLMKYNNSLRIAVGILTAIPLVKAADFELLKIG